MNDPAARLVQDRVTREAALAAFTANLTQVKNDLEARGIGGRIADQAGKEVRAGFNEALAIADGSKGIVAATIAALVLWFLRNPLIESIRSLVGDQPSDASANPPQVQAPVARAVHKTEEPIA